MDTPRTPRTHVFAGFILFGSAFYLSLRIGLGFLGI